MRPDLPPPSSAPLPAAPPAPDRLDAIADDLVAQGYSLVEDLVPLDLAAALTTRVAVLETAGALIAAGIGRGPRHHHTTAIRDAAIHWLSLADPAEAAYLALMEGMRQAINARLFLGLFEYEGHFALYAPGGFYDRHLDAFGGARNRVLTIVSYLNPDWTEADGGALVVWPRGAGADDPPVARLLPQGRSSLVFLSEESPHAVEPTRRRRVALPGWFRVNGGGDRRADPPPPL